MIRKRLRVSSGWTLPILSALVAAVTVAAFVVNLWLTTSLYDYEILSEISVTDTLVKVGWGIRLAGMALFFLFVLTVAKKSLQLMSLPVVLYAIGTVVGQFPKILNGSISLEGWIIVVTTIVMAWLFVLVATNTLQAKEPLIVIGLIALAGIAVLTVMKMEPFFINREVFGEKKCLAVSELVRLAGFFLSITLLGLSLENMFRAEVEQKDAEGAKEGDGREAKAEDSEKKDPDRKLTKAEKAEEKKAAKAEAAKAAKSDGNTVNWALLRAPAPDGEKKTAEEKVDGELSEVDALVSETAEAAALEVFPEAAESIEEGNRKIAELTETEPTFEEEMNLLDEFESTRPEAPLSETEVPATSASISAEDGVEIVQYAAPVEDETPAEEKTLAQLLAERGLANHKSELFDEPFDDSPEPDYSTPVRPTYRETKPEEPEEVAEEVAEAVETVEAVEPAAFDAAAEAAETVEEAGDVFAAEAEEAAGSVAAAAAAAELAQELVGETAEEVAGETSSKFEDFFGGTAAETEPEVAEEPVKEAEAKTEFTEKNRKREAAARIRSAAEKIAAEEPELTVPVTPVTGNRLQKVLKEEVITDRDQQLMQRRRVSAFAVIGMIISLAAVAVGVLTTFKVVEIEALKNEQTCIMIFGFGLLGFLMAGTRLFYKEYYTKTVLNERKVTREESNWEEYVANRLEEDEKNIAALAQNYVRMTEMYGHLLETTAELTNSVKALGVRQAATPSLTAAEEPLFTERAAEAPAYEAPSEEAPEEETPAVEAPAYEAPVYEAPAEEAPAYEEPAEEVVEEATAYEEPSAEETAEETPAYEEPAYETPAYEEPAYETPAYEEPAYETVTEEAPAYEGPVFADDEKEYEESAFAAGEPAYYTGDETENVEKEAPVLPDPASLMRKDELPYETEPTAAAGGSTFTEEPTETAASSEAAAETIEEPKPASTGGASANAAILSSLFSGKWSKNRKEEPEEKKEAPAAEPTPAEPVKTATETEAPRTGNYNEFLINSMFGRKPAKQTPVEEVKEAVEEVAEEATEATAEVVEEAVEEATETAEEAVEEVTETAEGFVEEATEAVEETVEEATETAEEAVEEATEAVEKATETAEEATEAAEEVAEEFTGAEEEFSEAAEETIEETAQAAEETVDEAVEEAEKMPNYVMTGMESTPSYTTETAAMTDAFAKTEQVEEEDDLTNAFVQSSEGDSWNTVKPLFSQFGYGSLANSEEDAPITGSYGNVTTYDEPASKSYEEPAATSGSIWGATSAWETPGEASETVEANEEPAEAFAENEPVAEAVAEAAETVAETVAEPVAEAVTETAAEAEQRRPAYRPSIYGTDVLIDENAGDEMPAVNIPPMVEAAPEEEAVEEPIVTELPTFTGVPDYSNDEPVPEDDAAEDMYNGSYRSKYLSSLRTAKNDRKKQFFFEDEDDFSVGEDDSSVFHGAEVPQMAIPEDEPAAEEADGMFAEPDLPMTELDFAEPELPEEAPAAEEAVPEATPVAEAAEKVAEAVQDSVEDERARLEARRKMLQERLDQIRKKNQMNQFDDLSDLDDEGVFFHK